MATDSTLMSKISIRMFHKGSGYPMFSECVLFLSGTLTDPMNIPTWTQAGPILKLVEDMPQKCYGKTKKQQGIKMFCNWLILYLNI